MNTDARVALGDHKAIAARKQQRRALHLYGQDVVHSSAQLRAKLETGIDDGMEYDAGWIGLVGILGDFPGLAETAGQRFEIRLVTHRPRPSKRPLDRARAGGIAAFGQ